MRPSTKARRKRGARTNAIERHTVITLSTGHVPESLATIRDGLDRNGMEHVALMTGEHGWLINVDRDLSSIAALHEPSITDALKEILWWAKRRGADYVLFDADGPYVERFPIYDW